MAPRLARRPRLWALAIVVGFAAVAVLSGSLSKPPPSSSFGPRSPAAAASRTAPATPPATATARPSIGPGASPGAPSPDPTAELPACPAETERFPAGYAAYHTYAELCRTLVAAAAAHPEIARLRSIGQSWEGRELFEMEIGAHLDDGTHPPGVLFDGGTHGLEHLSVELPLAIMGWLLDGYGTDEAVTRLVESRVIFLVFDVDPDGAAYDIRGGRFHEWRKNRQPNGNGTVGTDLNRNYDDHWGCCGRVSATPRSSYYRGSAPFSAPETQAVRDLVESLVFDGRQQIRAAVTFHASGRLILWPYGYTRTAVPGDMAADDHAAFVALARHMAKLNGYEPEQASSLYVDSGTARDWYYGAQGIFAFTFELGTGTYQRSPLISSEAARNRSAILYLIDAAGCPRQVVDPAITCG